MNWILSDSFSTLIKLPSLIIKSLSLRWTLLFNIVFVLASYFRVSQKSQTNL